MIYGCDRAEFKSFEAWQRFLGAPEPAIQHMRFIHHIGHSLQALPGEVRQNSGYSSEGAGTKEGAKATAT
jgi:hypothetical protein